MSRPVPVSSSVRWPTPGWWLALLPLIVLAHEGHELAHTLAGRLACGQWAQRDFSSWSIVGCDSLWPTVAGPAFSYLLMFVGMFGLRRAPERPGWPLALLVAANPLARLVTALGGHGDEVRVGQALAAAGGTVAIALVVMLTAAALHTLWQATRGWRWRGGAFALLALAAIGTVGPGTMAGNRLLRAGWLAQPLAGAPLLIHAVTGAAVIMLLAVLAGRRLLPVPENTPTA